MRGLKWFKEFKQTCGNSVNRKRTRMTIRSLVVRSVLFRRLDGLARLLTVRPALPMFPLRATTRTLPLPVVCTAAVVVVAGTPCCTAVGSMCCDDGCCKWLILRPIGALPPAAVCGVLNRRPSLSLADRSSALYKAWTVQKNNLRITLQQSLTTIFKFLLLSRFVKTEINCNNLFSSLLILFKWKKLCSQ